MTEGEGFNVGLTSAAGAPRRNATRPTPTELHPGMACNEARADPTGGVAFHLQFRKLLRKCIVLINQIDRFDA